MTMENSTEPVIGRYYIYDHGDYTNLALCYRIEEDYIYFIEQDNGSDEKLWLNRVKRETFYKTFVEEDLWDENPDDYPNYNGWIQCHRFRDGLKLFFEKGLYNSTFCGITQDHFFDVKVAWATHIVENGIEDKRGKYNIDYYAYLQTEHWKLVRKTKIQSVDGKCQLCGSKDRLEVHHNSYEHLGKEEQYMNDLIVLCHDCHSKFHDKI